MKISILLGLGLACLLIDPCIAGEYPAAPPQDLPWDSALPTDNDLILRVEQSDLPDKDVGRPSRGVRIFNLSTGRESRWALSDRVLRQIDPQGMRAGWSPRRDALLYRSETSAVFFSRDGSASPLLLQAPGKLPPFEGIENMAVSPDGTTLAFYLYTRDIGDRQPDGFGKLYTSIEIQKTTGSAPILVEFADFGRPNFIAWKANSKEFAVIGFDALVRIFDTSGKMLKQFSIKPPGSTASLELIREMHWQPGGTKLAFTDQGRLYVVDADGSNLKEIKVQHSESLDKPFLIDSFSWSPDGSKFAFSSSFMAVRVCSNPMVMEGSCIAAKNVFTANADGSALKKINAEPEFTINQLQLFWVGPRSRIN